MLSSEQLITFIKSGRNIRVVRCGNDNRLISILDQRGQVKADVEVPRDLYEGLMTQTLHALAERHGSDLRIEVKRDFYGVARAIVHSGLFGRRTAQLGISPRHIAMLHDALQVRAMEEQAI